MREPGFWKPGSALLPGLLSPLGAVYAAATARRVARPGWVAPAPVICCGGVTAGGAGKTPVALDLGARLHARSLCPAYLTRGYGGSGGRVRQVDPGRDDPGAVGDEALLLAEIAPTFVCADRAAAARAALAHGARSLVMDDGLQNPSLAKSCALLVVDGASGFGNGRVIPAGPLREPVAAAAARCRAVILVGEDRAGAAAMLPPGMTVLRARLVPLPAPEVEGRRVLGFAGIARPEKFFASLREAGAEPIVCRSFPDHHRYAAAELAALAREAAAAHAILVTTAKDAVRLPAATRAEVTVLRVRLAWEDVSAIESLLDEIG